MLFNINSRVRVKLTPAGMKHHRLNHDEQMDDCVRRGFPTYPYHPPQEDGDGWSEWQLWHLMSLFGPIMSMGSDPPFEMVIEIPDEE